MDSFIDLVFKIIGIITFIIIDIYLLQKGRAMRFNINFRFLRFRLFWEIVILLIFGIFIFFSPWLFIKSSLWHGFDFRTTGGIGDTINGIAGPFIAFFAALLVYLTLREQIKANLLLMEQNDFKFILDNIEFLAKRTDVTEIYRDAVVDFNANRMETINIKKAILIQRDFKSTLEMVSRTKTNQAFLRNRIKLVWVSTYRPEMIQLNTAIVERGVIAGLQFVIGTPLSFSQDFNSLENTINGFE